MIKDRDIKNAEFIIINDGSKDNTLSIAHKYSKESDKHQNIDIRVLDLVYNQGKGAAVKYVSSFYYQLCRGLYKLGVNIFSFWMQMVQLISMNYQKS